jgi:hypothetical protein
MYFENIIWNYRIKKKSADPRVLTRELNILSFDGIIWGNVVKPLLIFWNILKLVIYIIICLKMLNYIFFSDVERHNDTRYVQAHITSFADASWQKNWRISNLQRQISVEVALGLHNCITQFDTHLHMDPTFTNMEILIK